MERSSWTQEALTTLFEEGLERVKVELLARRLGVTKGSFYWHFRNRDELLASMVEEWERQQNGHVERLAAAPQEDGAARLAALMDFILTKDSRHDLGLRTWARHDARAAAAVERVDRMRLDYVESLFRAMALSEEQVQLRARMLYFYQVGEHTSSIRDEPAQRARHSALRQALLSRSEDALSAPPPDATA